MDTTLEKVLNPDVHEDYVEYFIFPPENPMLRSGDDSQTEDEKLEEVLYNLNAAAQEIVGEYLWHRDPFVLKLEKKSTASAETNDDDEFNGTHFHGVTRFGDNVEDEWLIVYLLTQISIKFPELIVRVIDNDGEFLLIEAADYLPEWAESDASCAKRVYVHQGHVHLIPKLTSTFTDDQLPMNNERININDALRAVISKSQNTVASKAIQRAISDKISEYPGRITTSLQHANVYLHPKLAEILKLRPSLVPSAVHAFYQRDPTDLKSARLMPHFNPKDGLVKTRVRFTKCLYAMLMKQDFRPDMKTGWEFPRPSSYEFKAHSLGAKLTTGFEILLARSIPNGSISTASNPTSLVGWKRYEASLKKTGYFRDYLEGSKPYQQLAERAKVFFISNLTGDSDVTEVGVQDILKLIETVQVNIEEFNKVAKDLPDDDDDTWMTINPDNLESMLDAQFKAKNLNSNPEDIPAKLKEFMKQFSDFEGVGNPNGTTNGQYEEGDILKPLDFRADDFVSSMDKLLLELGKPDKDWDDSDDSFGSDEEVNEQLDEIKKMHNFKKDSKIFQLMNQMDAELTTTEVGKSFVPSTTAEATNSTSSTSKSSNGVKFTTNPAGPPTMTDVEELDEFDDVESFKPVNIDMNALANILESFQSQDGPSGPSANLLRSVGFDMSHMYSKKKPK